MLSCYAMWYVGREDFLHLSRDMWLDGWVDWFSSTNRDICLCILSATGAGGYLGSVITENGEHITEFSTTLNGAGNQGITAENMEKSQRTDFNEDTTNQSASVACSNVRLWKLDTQKEWRNTSWRLWDEATEKDSVGFTDSEENKWVGS